MTDIKITITIAGATWQMSFHDDLLPLPEHLKNVPIVELIGIKLDDLRKRGMSEIRASNVLRNAQEATQEAQDGLNGAEEVPTEPQSRPEALETISDGFGSEWSKRCPECGQDTMKVVRPGKSQCMNCG